MERASTRTGRLAALFLGLTACLLFADQLTKLLALRFLLPGRPIPLIGDWVRLALTLNVGSAFGIVSRWWVPLAAGAAVCAAIILYAAAGRGLARHPQHAPALGLVFGGSLGNLLDRLRMRAVIDFIDIRWWPVFNVADIGITVGFVLLAVSLLRRR